MLSKLARAAIVAWCGVAASGCREETTTPAEARPRARRLAGVVEITFHNVGSPTMTSSALVARSVEELMAKRARGVANVQDRAASFDLTVPRSSSGPGTDPATIQIELETEGAATLTTGTPPVRYIRTSYVVRNAETDGVAFDTPRRNLTFVPVSTSATIGDTPVLRLLKQDGSPANPDLARQLLPTGLVELAQSTEIVVLSPDILQVLTENELTPIQLPSAVTNIFPYGFIVRRSGSSTTRSLDASPGGELFQGHLTVSYRIPAQTNPSENPTTISFMMLALDDSETRLTQSLEEQTPAAADAVRNRAISLGASLVTVLPGGAISGPFTVRRVCSVRTAGLSTAPTAFLVNAPSSFQSLVPNPNSGSAIPASTNFQATFSGPVTGANSTTFAVRGSASGQAFVGQAYSGNGTATITTPTKTFSAGEEVSVVISSAISCPNGASMQLRVASSRGQGNFFPAVTLTARDSTFAVANADFNRDGKIDIVSANLSANNVSVFLNSGNMTFQTQKNFAVGNHPIAVATGDFSGDGNPDIVVANVLDRTVSVLIGRGDGTFETQTTIGTGTGRSLAVADVDNDGRLDIAVANAEGTVTVLLNNGNGTFRSQLVTASDAGKHTSIAAGDLNRDGAVDLVVTDSTSGNVSVWLGTGHGAFPTETRFNVGAGPSSVGIGDFNNDGIPDLAVANRLGKSVATLLGTGTGSFQTARTFEVGNQPVSLVVADFDGDGRLDVTTANLPDRETSTLMGNGDGTFQGRRTFFIGESPRCIIAADYNNDGIIDLAVANGVQQGTVSVFQGRSA